MATLLVLVAGAAGSQDQPGRLPPSEATTVLVDVVVRDKRGQPVTSLTVSDFEVLEDGVPQRVAQFSLAGVGGAASAAPTTAAGVSGGTPSPRASATPSGLGPAAPATIAFVFDRLSTEGRVAAQKAVHAFAARKEFGARAGMFSLENTLVVLQDFTTDPALTVAAVDALSTRVTQVGSTVTERAQSQARNHIRANADASTLAILKSKQPGKPRKAPRLAWPRYAPDNRPLRRPPKTLSRASIATSTAMWRRTR